ncbi:hypothetical protein PVAP13_5NG087881 [Panicum virgatum]|uniref:Uncharacterized protein n=1 Tax=Panicum virgatum TaxID=38727 RepID=A0A8T0RQ80_PANVG|nr:hypothetical protein PVAP13_5NG087881 [Panicum virgatum]
MQTRTFGLQLQAGMVVGYLLFLNHWLLALLCEDHQSDIQGQ